MHAALGKPVCFRLQSSLDLRVAVLEVPRLPCLARFNKVDQTLVATVVAELGSNILKYAGAGQLRVQGVHDGLRSGVELVAEDHGPGIADIPKAMQEHYSSSGSLGMGLSGVQRMVSELDVVSTPGRGTRIVARKWDPSYPRTADRASIAGVPALGESTSNQLRLEIGTANRPCYPEHVSGDSTLVLPVAGGMLLACIDASGHGKAAHLLAQRLTEGVRAAASPDLARLLRTLHTLAVGSIGAAVSLAFVDTAGAELRFAGIGNIRIRCLGQTPWTGIARDGVLGERFPSPDVQRFELHAEDLVLMYSDGVRQSLSSQAMARLHLSSAQQIADNLLRQAGRSTDDASCIVVKCRR
ncbi:hypothetical protein RD110_18500 [Rhodoferax koreense]|uniref:PPM-type phosphatase domain-containing protein n=1 Tax=Rhodoferax koreensis TaxID=1842727 RepID=A0A1P8JYX0_9BURK|nr:ATP-binding SpoIIE family protein phosphatase [Rhodoferax koreense]APW38947.1 hypothetical protein RD110_18500 [Rhodoferax koreense]